MIRLLAEKSSIPRHSKRYLNSRTILVTGLPATTKPTHLFIHPIFRKAESATIFTDSTAEIQFSSSSEKTEAVLASRRVFGNSDHRKTIVPLNQVHKTEIYAPEKFAQTKVFAHRPEDAVVVTNLHPDTSGAELRSLYTVHAEGISDRLSSLSEGIFVNDPEKVEHSTVRASSRSKSAILYFDNAQDARDFARYGKYDIRGRRLHTKLGVEHFPKVGAIPRQEREGQFEYQVVENREIFRFDELEEDGLVDVMPGKCGGNVNVREHAENDLGELLGHPDTSYEAQELVAICRDTTFKVDVFGVTDRLKLFLTVNLTAIQKPTDPASLSQAVDHLISHQSETLDMTLDYADPAILPPQIFATLKSNNTSLAQSLVANGLTRICDFTTDFYHKSLLQNLVNSYTDAKNNQLGIWENYQPRKLVKFNGIVRQILSPDTLVIEDTDTEEFVKIGLSGVKLPTADDYVYKIAERIKKKEQQKNEEKLIVGQIFYMPHFQVAKQRLVDLALNRKVEVETTGERDLSRKSYGSVLVPSENDGGTADLATEMVEFGFLLPQILSFNADSRVRAYDELHKAAKIAREQNRGVFDTEAILPEFATISSKSAADRWLVGGKAFGKKKAAIEKIHSLSNFELFLPEEALFVNCILEGVERPTGQEVSEQLRQLKNDILHREVDVEVKGVDKHGNLKVGLEHSGENLAVMLLKNGLVKTHFSADKLADGSRFFKAESEAQEKRLGIWKDYDDQEHKSQILTEWKSKSLRAELQSVLSGTAIKIVLPRLKLTTVVYLTGLKQLSMTESTEAEQRSKEYLADMLADHALEVALDHIENSDDFYSSANSLYATVWVPYLKSQNVAVPLLTEGLAQTSRYTLEKLPTAVQRKLQTAENTAKRHRRGIWSDFDGEIVQLEKPSFPAAVVQVSSPTRIAVELDDGTITEVQLTSVQLPSHSDFGDTWQEQLSSLEKECTDTKRAFNPVLHVPLYHEAKEFTRSQLIGQRVEVVCDFETNWQSGYGRKRRWPAASNVIKGTILLGRDSFTTELVKNGLVKLVVHSPMDDNRTDNYEDLKKDGLDAKLESLGMFAKQISPPGIKAVNTEEEANEVFLSLKIKPVGAVLDQVVGPNRLRCIIPGISDGTDLVVVVQLNGVWLEGRGDGREYAMEQIARKILQRKIEITVTKTNGYGVFYAFVQTAYGEDLAESLLREGLLTVHEKGIKSLDYSEADRYFKAESEAKSNAINVWSPEWESRRETITNPAYQTSKDEAAKPILEQPVEPEIEDAEYDEFEPQDEILIFEDL